MANRRGRQTLDQPSRFALDTDNMSGRNFTSRCKTIIRAWPPAGAIFIILSFIITAIWLVLAIFNWPGEFGWMEPLSAILAGTGAFILAAILIFRRVDSARAEADTYGLARGLATGYYFNFVRPLIQAIEDKDHSLHAQVAGETGHKAVGLVIGLPQAMEDFEPEQHEKLLNGLTQGANANFKLEEIKVNIEGRPRPVFARIARSTITDAAIIVDIPTTLSVIADFARFFADQELSDAPIADEAVTAAREEIVASSQRIQFEQVLTEFIDVAFKVSSLEASTLHPATILHVVPVHRLGKRLNELGDH